MSQNDLSDDLIAALSIPAKIDKKAFTSKIAKGLQLIVSWKGSAVRARPSRESYHFNWYFRFKIPGNDKRSQIKIGAWPNMTTMQALKEAERMQNLVVSGVDPRSNKLKERAERIDQAAKEAGLIPIKLRFEYVLNSMEEHWPQTGKDASTFRRYRQALEKHAYPVFLGRNIRGITGKEWDDLIAKLAHIDGMPGAASNTHKAGRRLFSFAVDQELLQYNPLLQRKSALKATRLSPDERFLEADEVHRFLNEIDLQPIPERARVNLKLMMLVGVRVDEWERVKIGWINFNKQRIEHPAESMKNRRKAWTHLPKQSIEVLLPWLNQLKEWFGPLHADWYLFPCDDSPTIAERTKLSDHTSGIKDWLNFSPKLLRKTISTQLQRQGCPPAVLRAIRNQTITDGVESHYDFDDLFHLKKQWIETWAELLDSTRENPKALHTDRDSELDSELSSKVLDLFQN